ncbi:Ger(x)C family spore germination protein [Paenibacillus sp. LPE1-1-1.1]|uniref:Ger(x)C family spore germination protein n=1 Tax=Paenibacillus sp. LPE1-1-1.1 TaxID=3135230 RepID=UPI00341F1F4C
MKTTFSSYFPRLLLLLLCLVCLSGCWDRTEINDLAIVTGAGFDLTEDRKIKLTIQLFVPGTSSDSQSMGSGPSSQMKQSLVESAVGLNTSDAASKLQELLSRKFFWGQADVFIFGEKLARSGIQDPMDFLARHPHPRERANVYISKGTADQVLNWQPQIERNSAEVLREMSVLQTGLNVALLDAIVEFSDEAHTALIPWIRLKKSGNKISPYLAGAASFKDLKMNQVYDVQETRGLLWLRNEIKTATLTAHPEGGAGFTTLNILDSRCQLTPSIQDGKWKVNIAIKAAGNLIQNTADIDVVNPAVIDQLETQFASVLKERIQMAVKIAKKTNTDVLGFSDQFHRHYPKEWNKHKKNWDQIFPAIEVNYKVKITVLRSGLIGKNKMFNNPKGDQP